MTDHGAAADGLHALLYVDRDGFVLDVDLRVRPGQVLALLGPNGAGKSTALRALAGLHPLTAGTVELDGRCLDDPRSGRFAAVEHRPVGMVFQDYLLFPHLSAIDNVAFGLRARGLDRRRAHWQALQWLTHVGLEAYASARPSALSGGQAQRVALARALATEPRLLLLDEPLAALDADTRLRVRSTLRRHLTDYTGATVLVTHDPLDAMVLADYLVIVEDGHVVQRGTPREVARAPRTEYVARLVGLNLYRGTARGRDVAVVGGGRLHVAEAFDGEVYVAFPPSAVALHRYPPAGVSPRNTWPGRVASLEQRADIVRVRLDASPPVLADITAAAVADLDLALGVDVWAALKATETHAYPA
jgi:molybdate transport system ATP-binding protein